MWQLGNNGYFQGTSIATGPAQGPPGGTPTLSHNNGANGIVWFAGVNYGIRAYDATSTGNLQPIFTDNPGGITKFQTVVVANGLAFLGGTGAVHVYGPK